jgi:hypothetical protein
MFKMCQIIFTFETFRGHMSTRQLLLFLCSVCTMFTESGSVPTNPAHMARLILDPDPGPVWPICSRGFVLLPVDVLNCLTLRMFNTWQIIFTFETFRGHMSTWQLLLLLCSVCTMFTESGSDPCKGYRHSPVPEVLTVATESGCVFYEGYRHTPVPEVLTVATGSGSCFFL